MTSKRSNCNISCLNSVLSLEICRLSNTWAAEMGTVFLKNERSRIFMKRLIGGRNMFRSMFEAEIVLIIREIVFFVFYYFH